MARIKLEIGYAPNDGKGDQLRDGAILIEDALNEIYVFLSGMQSGVDLGRAIPVTSGGTGVNTDAGLHRLIQSKGASYFAPNAGKYVAAAVCYARTGTDIGFKVLTENTKVLFYRVGAGRYVVECPAVLEIQDNRIHFEPDNMGNVKVGAKVTKTAQGYTIETFGKIFNSSSGMYSLNTSDQKDIPEDNLMHFTLVSSLAPSP